MFLNSVEEKYFECNISDFDLIHCQIPCEIIALQPSNWECPTGDAAIVPIHQDKVLCQCVITIFQRIQVMI